MSIFIKGMEMPKNCSTCPCFQYNMFDDDIDGYCKTLKTKITDSDKHHSNCLLIEIPTPHGRLIDADKIDYRNDAMHDGTGHLVIADNFMNGVLWINDCIDNAPTVIEAERSEE